MMTDKEKVANGLKCCMHDEDDDHGRLCEECPYDRGDCRKDLYNDTLELLKKQEPVKPFLENYWKNTMGRCGHCKAPLPALEGLRSKFCWMCGRAVKWDE